MCESSFHGLRHTNITLLLKSGVDVGTVADNSGHSQKKTTLDYDDPLPSARREVANKIDDALVLKDTIPELLDKPTNIRRKRKQKDQEQNPE
jgi:integrase